MKYYKVLDIDSNQVTNFFQNYYETNKTNLDSFWNNINTDYILKACPSIVNLFTPFNINIKKISLISTSNTSIYEGIHKDNTIEKVRINIPILNCEYSSTNFYKTNKNATKKFLKNGVPYFHYNRFDCQLVDTLCLTRPTVLNIHELHQIVVIKPNTRRISCTISFYENIENLLY